MNIPAMDYIGGAFCWVFVVVLLLGFFWVNSKTARKWVFLLLFAGAWFVMGISYIFLLTGTPASAAIITGIRSLGYVVYAATIITAIVEVERSH